MTMNHVRGVPMIDPQTGEDYDWEFFLDWLDGNEGDYADQYVAEHESKYEEFWLPKYEAIVPPTEPWDEWFKGAQTWAKTNEPNLIPDFTDSSAFRQWVYRNFWSQM